MRKEELRKGLQKGGSLQNTGSEDPSEGPPKEGPGPFHEIRGGTEEGLPDETTGGCRHRWWVGGCSGKESRRNRVR